MELRTCSCCGTRDMGELDLGGDLCWTCYQEIHEDREEHAEAAL